MDWRPGWKLHCNSYVLGPEMTFCICSKGHWDAETWALLLGLHSAGQSSWASHLQACQHVMQRAQADRVLEKQQEVAAGGQTQQQGRF